MTRTLNVKKASISFLVAALVPGIVAFLMSSQPLPNFTSIIFGISIFYFFSLPAVFLVGFLSLSIALKFKYGLILVPPAIGIVSGLLVAKSIYTQGMNMEGLTQFTISGLATAMVAAIIYSVTTKSDLTTQSSGTSE